MAINVWRRFGDLIKPPTEEVVTVTTVHGDGTVTATTVGGGAVRLRCAIEVTVGDKAFAAAGEVRGVAPVLSYFEIEV